MLRAASLRKNPQWGKKGIGFAWPAGSGSQLRTVGPIVSQAWQTKGLGGKGGKPRTILEDAVETAKVILKGSCFCATPLALSLALALAFSNG